MYIHRYQYNINFEELEITDTFQVNDITTEKIYLSSDDPDFTNKIVVLNSAKQTDCRNAEVVEVYSLDIENAKAAIQNYINQKIFNLNKQIDYYKNVIHSLMIENSIER